MPNRAARALVTQRTDSVALVISESEERVFGEPFFAGIVRGISTALRDARLQLGCSHGAAQRRNGRLDDYLTRQHVDGVLLLSLHDDDPLPERCRPSAVCRSCSAAGADRATSDQARYVDADNALGARLAVDHLLHRGRSAIATIAGPQDMVVGRTRHEGYLAGLRGRRARAADDARRATATSAEDSGESGDAGAARRAARTSTPSSAPTT